VLVKNRENWVDYAKAIGIILVVYGHVARGLYNGGINFPVYFYQITDSVIYSFHMPLFFFLSGLFFYNSFSKKGSKKLIFSKIDTIFYPYVIWSILQGTIEIVLSSYTNANASPSDVFSLLWSPRAHFWFLYALLSIFVVLSIVYSVISRRFTIPVFICSLALYLSQSLLPQGLIFGYISNNLVFFVLGIVFTMYFRNVHFSSWVAFSCLAASFVVAQWFFHIYLSHTYNNQGIESFLLACISIALVVSISLLFSRADYKFLAYIGTSSMGIYLMHILAGSGSRIILSKAFGVESVVTHLVVGCLVAIMVPLVALFLIDKLKLKYLLTAPVSNWVVNSYNKLIHRAR
jgi:fucose 4-O-acetylase-like acetyltransferase